MDSAIENVDVCSEYLTLEEKRELDSLLNVYEIFRKRYYDDPVAFVKECIDWPEGTSATQYQLEMLSSLVEKHRVCVRGPHGLGKTATAAWAILWFALTRDGEDWKIPVTASVWRQLTKFLFPEIHKWAHRLRWGEKIGRSKFAIGTELLSLNLKLTTGEAFALASNRPDALEGAHADHLLYILDEAKSIPDEIWDSIEGALLGEGEALAFAISTPGVSHGRFYRINLRGAGVQNWHVTHITVEDAIAAGRIQRERTDYLKELWGEKSPIYTRRVLGNFADDSLDGLIPLSWVEAANARWADAQVPLVVEATNMGVDVGGGALGGDQSVIAIAKGKHLIELRKISQAYEPDQATMELVGQVRGILDVSGMEHNDCFIDVIGIGAGVLARLREMGYAVSAFNSSSKTSRKDRSGELGYANWRAAGWAILRDALSPSNDDPLLLPEDDELLGDLTAPKISLRSDAKYLVEAKDKIRERLGRSTDCGDAVMMMIAGPSLRDEGPQAAPVVVSGGVEKASSWRG